MDEFMSLRQEGMVYEYGDEFKFLLNKVRISEDYAVYCFIFGLKPEIGDILMWYHNMDKGLEMEEAMSTARLREKIFNSDSVQGRDMPELKEMVMILLKRFQKNKSSSNQMASSDSEVSMFVLEPKSDSSNQIESPYPSQFTKLESAHQVFEEMPIRVGNYIQENMDEYKNGNDIKEPRNQEYGFEMENMGNVQESFDGDDSEENEIYKKDNQVYIGLYNDLHGKDNSEIKHVMDSIMTWQEIDINSDDIYQVYPSDDKWDTKVPLKVGDDNLDIEVPFVVSKFTPVTGVPNSLDNSHNQDENEVLNQDVNIKRKLGDHEIIKMICFPIGIGVGILHYGKQFKWLDTGWVLFDITEVPKKFPPDRLLALQWHKLEERKGKNNDFSGVNTDVSDGIKSWLVKWKYKFNGLREEHMKMGLYYWYTHYQCYVVVKGYCSGSVCGGIYCFYLNHQGQLKMYFMIWLDSRLNDCCDSSSITYWSTYLPFLTISMFMKTMEAKLLLLIVIIETNKAVSTCSNHSDLWQQWHYDYGVFTELTTPVFIFAPENDGYFQSSDGKKCPFSSEHTYLQIHDSNKSSAVMVKASCGCFVVHARNSSDISSKRELMGSASNTILVSWEKGDRVEKFLTNTWFERINSFNLLVLQCCGGTIYPKMQLLELLWVDKNLQESWLRTWRLMDLSVWCFYKEPWDDTLMCCTVYRWTSLGRAHMQHVHENTYRDIEACGWNDDYWLTDYMSGGWSFGSNYSPCSQTKKRSIGVIVDSSAKMKSNNGKGVMAYLQTSKFQTKPPGEVAYAYYDPPTTSIYQVNQDEKPPLWLMSHEGPTFEEDDVAHLISQFGFDTFD